MYISQPITPIYRSVLHALSRRIPQRPLYRRAWGLAGREQATDNTPPALFYSIHPPECIDGNYEAGVEMSDKIADYIYNANYFINLHALKREGTIGQTIEQQKPLRHDEPHPGACP